MARSTAWFDSPLWLSSASSLLLWAALPPLGWWPLAWIAPVFWLRLIRQDPLRGRRPYVAIWFSSALFWMAVMQGIRLAHWANYLGLVALGSYLGIYVPLFIAVARHAVHRWQSPAAAGCTHRLDGRGTRCVAMGLWAFPWPRWRTRRSRQLSIIQVADLFGAYTISFVVMSVAAGMLTAWSDAQRRGRALAGAVCPVAGGSGGGATDSIGSASDGRTREIVAHGSRGLDSGFDRHAL